VTVLDHVRVALLVALLGGLVLGVVLGRHLAPGDTTPHLCHGTLAIETRPGGLLVRCEGAP
jgi:hypothetical protein